MAEPMTGATSDLDAIRKTLAATNPAWIEAGEILIATRLTYLADVPVQVRVRKRDHRYDISDDGTAVALAARPRGWLAVAGRCADQEGFNVNRRGVISVPAVEGRDLAPLTERLAITSRQVYLALLDRD